MKKQTHDDDLLQGFGLDPMHFGSRVSTDDTDVMVVQRPSMLAMYYGWIGGVEISRAYRPSAVFLQQSNVWDATTTIDIAFNQGLESVYPVRHRATPHAESNPRVDRFVLARKVRECALEIDQRATVGEPSDEKRSVDEHCELRYATIPVRIPRTLDYDRFADDLADLLITRLTNDEFMYLALDLWYH